MFRGVISTSSHARRVVVAARSCCLHAIKRSNRIGGAICVIVGSDSAAWNLLERCSSKEGSPPKYRTLWGIHQPNRACHCSARARFLLGTFRHPHRQGEMAAASQAAVQCVGLKCRDTTYPALRSTFTVRSRHFVGGACFLLAFHVDRLISLSVIAHDPLTVL